MAGSDGELHSFGVGARVVHRHRGAGSVLEIMPDGRTRILFDSGEEHRYRPSSMVKLRAEGTALVLIVAEKVCTDAYLTETAAADAGSTDTRLQASQEAVDRLGASVALQLASNWAASLIWEFLIGCCAWTPSPQEEPGGARGS